MSLRLVAGRAGSGKTRLCLEEIRRALLDNPRGHPLYYIIPEQATFQAEYALATLPGIKGSIRASALSFRRLAFKVTREVGGGERLYIDDTGKAMVLGKVMERCRPQLKVFGLRESHPGVVENLTALYNELRRSRIPPAKLGVLFSSRDRGEGRNHPYLEGKIHDLALIYGEMVRELAGGYLDAQDYLDLLIDRAHESRALKEAKVWVDGFNAFNAQEREALKALLANCRQVTVTLCLDGEPLEEGLPLELDPFYPAARVFRYMKKAAADLEVPCRVQTLPSRPPRRFFSNPTLAHLEEHLTAAPSRPFQEGGDIQMVAAAHRHSEVEALARETIRLARDEGCRWRRMAVLAGDLEGYEDILAAVFRDYGIPYFLDRKRSVLHHPLVEFLRSALEVVQKNWGWDAVFRCAKTDLLLPTAQEEGGRGTWRERVNRLENYVLAFGIRGSRWFQDEPWSYRERDDLEETGGGPALTRQEEESLKEINETRDILRRPLLHLHQGLRGGSRVQEKALALYRLMEEVQVVRHLENWSQESLSRGDLNRVREHTQVYKLVVDLLDQLVDIMGDEQISIHLFIRVLEAGLEGLRLSLVPPALDQVLVGSPERTRPAAPSHVFILGAVDGEFPLPLQEDAIFSQEERETLTSLGIELVSLRERQLQDEEFLVYRTLTLPSQALWISHPLADEEGKGLVPSPVISRLEALFPGIRRQVLPPEPAPGDGAETILSFTAHPRRTLSHLAVQLGSLGKTAVEDINPLWWDIYNWYARQDEWRERTEVLLRGIFYENRERPLERETCRDLYGRSLTLSVSRLERFKSCPFSQFVSHGLRLKERRVYGLDLPGIGRFFHSALYSLARIMEERGLDFAHISREETLKMVDEGVNELIPLLQKEILLSSSRYRYLGKRLKDTVGRAALALREQALTSRFRPVGLELAFGNDMPTLSFSLADGTGVQLAGRIDRLDGARGDDGRYYLRVVDYKSGRASLDLRDVYHGLSLQIMAYLEVALASSVQWLGQEAFPAGVLYFRIHTPVLREKKPLPPERAREKLLKEYKMQGKIISRRELVHLMDSGLVRGGSAVIPAALTVKGDLRKSSSLVKPDDFDLLRCHVRKTIRESAAAIMGGDIGINPYSMAGKKACRYCRYKAVCQFDPLMKGNLFRYLDSLTDGEVFSLLADEM